MTERIGRIAAAVGVGVIVFAALAGGCAKKSEVPSRSPAVPPPPPKESTGTVEAAGPHALGVGELHAALVSSRMDEC